MLSCISDNPFHRSQTVESDNIHQTEKNKQKIRWHTQWTAIGNRQARRRHTHTTCRLTFAIHAYTHVLHHNLPSCVHHLLMCHRTDGDAFVEASNKLERPLHVVLTLVYSRTFGERADCDSQAPQITPSKIETKRFPLGKQQFCIFAQTMSNLENCRGGISFLGQVSAEKSETERAKAAANIQMQLCEKSLKPRGGKHYYVVFYMGSGEKWGHPPPFATETRMFGSRLRCSRSSFPDL